jgi:hypothetical protein
VVRASSWWQQLLNPIPRSLPIELQWQRFPTWKRKHFAKISRQIATALAIVLIGLWFWKLWLAIATGLLVTWLVYRMQQPDWRAYWLGWLRFARNLVCDLYTTNPQLTLALGCGGIAALGTYIAVSIWVEVPNHGLATWLILQSFGTLGISFLLVWQILSNRRANRQPANVSKLPLDRSDRY